MPRKVSVTIFVNIHDMLFCEQFKGSTFAHSVNENLLVRNSSLDKLIKLVGDDHLIRVSKSIAVSKKYVKSFDNESVRIRNPINGKEYSFHWSDKYYRQMELHLPPKKDKKGGFALSVTENHQPVKGKAWNIPRLLQKPNVNKVYFYIAEHSCCKMMDVSMGISMPSGTLNRVLALLKREGLIEYVGSKKTGGYCVLGLEKGE